MCLETALNENTAAIRELISLFTASLPNTVPLQALAPVEKPVAEVKELEEKTPEPEPAKTVSYQDAAAAVVELAKAKGREAATAVLQKFGVAKLPDLDPALFVEVIAACEKAMV